MKQYYQLWLDESGAFEDEATLKKQGKNPSLIGGLLLRHDIVAKVPFAELLGGSLGHACEMTGKDKTRVILPALEKLQTLGARQVFFENTAYEDDTTNRRLYLRMMAEGLVRLLQELNVRHESVDLRVLIAQRQDITVPHEQRRIHEKEYVAALERCIEQKRKEQHIVLDEDNELHFEIQVAARTKELMLADFACNTRLTRECKVLREQKARVNRLHKDAYILSMQEHGGDYFIKNALAQGELADAILELYTTADVTDEAAQFALMRQRMQSMGYRLVKSQLKHCAAELVAYASKLKDFEVGEAYLNKLNETLISFLKECGCYTEKFQFRLLLLLADMYLREGDTNAARRVLAECRAAHLAMEASMEEVFSYYQLVEKEALLCINEFDFNAGAAIMEGVYDAFLTVKEAIEQAGGLHQRFTNLKSEYFGDVLCMQIYAMMFTQRDNPEVYETLISLSDVAMRQYPGAESELERHRQYRAYIECEAQHFSDALKLLLSAKCYHVEGVTQEEIVGFLNAVHQSEPQGSCEYYMMYYLRIMAEAALQQDPLARVMYLALHQQETMFRILQLDEHSAEEVAVDLSDMQALQTTVLYHPMEIVYWKYATYLFMAKQYKTATLYYNKAIENCARFKNYTTMRLIGVGILAESIVALIDAKEYSNAERKCNKLKKYIAELQKEPTGDAAQAFLDKASELCAHNSDRKGIVNRDALWSISRLVTY